MSAAPPFALPVQGAPPGATGRLAQKPRGLSLPRVGTRTCPLQFAERQLLFGRSQIVPPRFSAECALHQPPRAGPDQFPPCQPDALNSAPPPPRRAVTCLDLIAHKGEGTL